MKVVVVDSGEAWSTGSCFVRAWKALGHEAMLFDQAHFFIKKRSLLGRAAGRLTRSLGQIRLKMSLRLFLSEYRPDLLLVMKGAFVSFESLEHIRSMGIRVVVFQNDDLENPLNATSAMRAAIPAWDLVLTPRRHAIGELRRRGARRVEYLPFAYDPLLHFAPDCVEDQSAKRQVVFVGTWAPERTEIFEGLNREGFPLSIFGSGWERLPNRSQVRFRVRPPLEGSPLRIKLHTAAVALCLLRKGNRDHHTMRTFEIPACEGFMLAERTDEHLTLFEEGREAVYFGSLEELVEQTRRWLPDEIGRRKVAADGRRRLVADGHRYEDRVNSILRMLSEG